jgi:hypothetical protein
VQIFIVNMMADGLTPFREGLDACLKIPSEALNDKN